MADNPWSRGKCGLKILQYMAAGLPVITSPAGVNEEMVAHGETGFIADTKDEWAGAIARLAGNRQLRESMGAAGRKKLTGNFTVGATFKRILNDLEQMDTASRGKQKK